jgi:RNA polymerase sigma factor (sigma-70 family)
MAVECEADPVNTAPMVQLVQQAQMGDTRAFEQLYRENVGRIYALCLRLCADPVRAEELTQDVFVRAWEKLSGFRGESAFSSWLHRLAVNVVLGERRSTVRRGAREVETEDLSVYEAPTRAADPGEQLDLQRAIEQLPESARTVFVMYEVEGYGHAEIAELTGRAEGTSKALLHRARKLLKDMLLP